MKRRIAVRGIAFKNGELLCVLHKDSQGNPVDFWAIPGGGLEVGEPLLKGLHREMTEETGIAPELGRLLFVQQFIGTDKSGTPREEMEYFFHIENPEDYEKVDLTKTSHGTAELCEITWVNPSKVALLPAFLRTYDIEAHINESSHVYLYNDIA